MRALLFLVCAVVVAHDAHADRGEVSLDLTAAGDAAVLLHPAVHDALQSPATPTATFAMLPRLGVGARYALSDELRVGMAVDVAAAPNLKASQVSVKNTTGDLFTGTYAEASLPLSLGWRLDTGHDFSGALELSAGPLVTLWSGSALADPTRLDANGLPSAFPVAIDDAWDIGGIARASAAFEVRLFDMLVVAIAPSVGVSWAGTVGARAGIAVTPSYVAGVGPL